MWLRNRRFSGTLLTSLLLDLKATVRLYDASLDQSDDDLEFCIFRPKREQFPELGAGDVVYAQSAKVSIRCLLVPDTV